MEGELFLMIKRALISVSKKDNLLKIAGFLKDNNVEIISTGGTYKFLKDNGIDAVEISDITNFEEILNGRVKTLHPNIHAGILAVRNNEEHMKTLKEKNIKTIDMVIVNLYPFFEKCNEDLSLDEKVEYIDIGGPTLLRAAAKNFRDVITVCDSEDYDAIINGLKENGDLDFKFRKYLASKVFNLISAYDAAISGFLSEELYPDYLSVSYRKKDNLRYGENPHQSAAFYVSTSNKGAMNNMEQLNGKELSYNNIKDMDAAWKLVNEFDSIACCAVKHNSPCGAAMGNTVYDAYEKTYNCDTVSIFGGIVAFNRCVDLKTAEELKKIFLEVIIAPDFDKDALEALMAKKNLRVIKCTQAPSDKAEFSKVDGGVLVQSADDKLIEELKVVTEKQPTDEEIKNMIFGMKVAKYLKSNAIVVVDDLAAVGMNGGQVNRILPAIEAIKKGKEKGAKVLISDGFFPFDDVAKEAAANGIKAIMQPGGSIRDNDSIEICNKNDMSMVFTGIRHFRH